MIRVFIGYDPREAVAFSVLSHSIHVRSSQPVSITPLMLSQLDGLMWRERNPLQSTDFSFSRFLAPHLSNYEGWSIFMDCDMLVLDDIAKLWAMRDDRYAVMCVKHDHQPEERPRVSRRGADQKPEEELVQRDDVQQREMPRLTPEYVNTPPALNCTGSSGSKTTT